MKKYKRQIKNNVYIKSAFCTTIMRSKDRNGNTIRLKHNRENNGDRFFKYSHSIEDCGGRRSGRYKETDSTQNKNRTSHSEWWDISRLFISLFILEIKAHLTTACFSAT